MSQEATRAVSHVGNVVVVEQAVTRAKTRVVNFAINEVDHLEMIQEEIDQPNADAADAVAALVNGTIPRSPP